MKKKTLCLITKYPSIIYHIYLTTYSQYHTTVQYNTVHKNYFSFGKWNTVWLICMCVYMWRLLRLYDAASVLITNRQQQCPHIFQQKTRPFRKVCLDHGSFSFFISCFDYSLTQWARSKLLCREPLHENSLVHFYQSHVELNYSLDSHCRNDYMLASFQ